MKKDELIASLEDLLQDLKRLEKRIIKNNGKQIKQQALRDEAKKVARKWFDIIEKQLPAYEIPFDVVTTVHGQFGEILDATGAHTTKAKYVQLIKEIRLGLKQTVIVPVYKFSPDNNSFDSLDALFNLLTDDEKPLMKEAIDCAKSGYYRASVILGWASAIGRLHQVVQKLGFDEFNKNADAMNKSQTPRFKRASKANANIQSISDLQISVFDNSLLWVLEFWRLLEYNQHERLTQCFVMRKGCAHPSLTTVSPENVASFFSDLKTIILDNPKFKL